MRIEVADATAPTAEEKAEIRKHVQNGTIWDILIETKGCTGRVDGVDLPNEQIHYFDAFSDAFAWLEYGD